MSARLSKSSTSNTSPHKRRMKWAIILLLVVGAVVDWSRPPHRQLSVPLYEWTVIRSYRATLRPLTSWAVHCRFKPTCSQYSLEAVQKHGLPTGAWLTLRRLGRDMPWVKSDSSDPVP